MSVEGKESVRSPSHSPGTSTRLARKPESSCTFHRQSSELTFLASNCASPPHQSPSPDEIVDPSSDTSSGHAFFRTTNPAMALPQREAIGDSSSKSPATSATATESRYYRVVFKGVVSLLEGPQSDAPRTGSFLSYGEIFYASPVIGLASSREDTVVRVHTVLTGGYTLDASYLYNVGYLFLRQNDVPIAEVLRTAVRSEPGPFHYQIISTTPIPILTGPSADAPKTRAVVLPKSIQEVSVRLRIGGDADAGDGVCFLRLNHRRGWISDRIVEPKSQSIVAVVREVHYDSSDALSTDGNSSIVSSSTSMSIPARSRHRPPRRRRDASNKDVDKSTLHKLANGKARIITTKTMQDTSDRSHAPSSNVSMMSDDSSQANPSQSTIQPALPQSLDSSFTTSHSAASLSNHSSTAHNQISTQHFFLMRVTAPRGLKILDAPQFQVNRLIRSGKLSQHAVSSSHMVSQLESNGPKVHHSIFQTMSGRLTSTGPSQSGNPAVFDSTTKSRLLPCGVVFEASTRMEITGSFSDGEGLIKLSDSSGWAIVPRREDLEQQHRNAPVGSPRSVDDDSAVSFQEVGSAALAVGRDSRTQQSSGEQEAKSTWLRVMTRTGLTVACPPPALAENDDETSPTSSRGSSAVNGSHHGSHAGLFPSNESDVASSVGSAFLDALFRTPKRESDIVKETVPRSNLDRVSQSNTIPCGMLLEVERWAAPCPTARNGRQFARLCGGQGWVPLTVSGKPTTARISRPEFRYGSFWFRVQSSRGLKVRLGPSTRAPSIKSDDGIYFRFECGEFLRASEVVTLFSDMGEPIESFVKLYRNRHARLHLGHEDMRSLATLSTQAEWVQAYVGQELFLEECNSEPRIERHKQGWRYNVLPETGVAVRKGPSFASEKTGLILFGGESVVVNERVTPSGDAISWLRMKDGQGWIHDVDDAGEHVVIAHSLRHRALSTRPRKPASLREGTDISYNDIIARLFHNDEGYHPRAEEGLHR